MGQGRESLSVSRVNIEVDRGCEQFALAAVGRTEGLLDYNRLRADMSSMVY